MLLTAVLAAAIATPSASAHAYVRSTSPADGAVLARSPALVSVRYGEPVATSGGALAVYDSAGDHVDSGRILRPGADEVAVAIDRKLPRGTYTVTWRLTSADTHVVAGAWVFSVGAKSAVPSGVAAKLRAQASVPASISVPFAVVRFLSFALLLACVGGAAALVFVLHDASDSTRRRLAGVLVALACSLAVCTLAGIALEGAAGGGYGIGEALHPPRLSDVLGTRFGQVWRWRAWLALAFALLAFVLERGPGGRARVRQGVLVLVALALVPTTSAAAHANVNGIATFAVDTAHVAAAAAWAGGLAFVGLALGLVPSGQRWALAARAVPRFSLLAVGALGLLAATGAANAYLEVQTWQGLWDTKYGWLVLTKIALLLPVLGLGALNNRVSAPLLRSQGASTAARRRFAWTIVAELAVAAGIVAVTAVLADEPRPKDRPASPAAAPSVYRTTSTVGPFRLQLAVSPGRPGANAVDVRLSTRNGKPAASIAEVQVAAALPGRNIAPLRFEAHRLGQGHFVVKAAQLAIAGRWRLTFTVRRGQFNEWLRTVLVPITKEG